MTLKNGFDTDRRIVIATPWDHFGTTSGQFWVPKIAPKAHWITVEGVYPQSLISNTPYTVLKDFGVQRPPNSAQNLLKIGSRAVPQEIKSTLGVLTLKMVSTLWAICVLKINPKAHWENQSKLHSLRAFRQARLRGWLFGWLVGWLAQNQLKLDSKTVPQGIKSTLGGLTLENDFDIDQGGAILGPFWGYFEYLKSVWKHIGSTSMVYMRKVWFQTQLTVLKDFTVEGATPDRLKIN